MPKGRDVPFLSLKTSYDEIAEEIEAAMLRVARSGWYIGGDEVEGFEAHFAAYSQAAHCIGVGNGLDALKLALLAVGVQAGDEVLVPAHTFIATWLAVSDIGAVPVAVPVRDDTYNLDVRVAEAFITPKTRAIVPVHLYGQAADLDAIHALCKRHDLRCVEDAAQAHGACWHGHRMGGHSDAVAWSFYPGKNLGALGDAGAVTTQDANIAARLRQLRNYGSTTRYVHEIQGFNSRLDPLQAAILGVKLRHLDAWNARRAQTAQRYLSAFADLPMVLPVVDPRATPVWHLFVIRHAQRDALAQALATQGVQSQIHYPIAPGCQGAYRGTASASAVDRAAQKLCNEMLSLPIGPELNEEQIAHVEWAVGNACRLLTDGCA